MLARAASAAVIIGAFLALGISVAPAHAATNVLSWADGGAALALAPGDTKPLTIQNETAAELKAIISTSPKGVVKVSRRSVQLPPGGTVKFTVSVKVSAVKPSSSVISVAVAPAAGLRMGAVLQRTITVGAAAAPVPAVTAAHGISRWGIWFGRSVDAVIPLASPASCALVDATSLSDLGYLTTDGGQRAHVSATCRDDDGKAELHLQFAGSDGSSLPRTGADYTGTLDFGDKSVTVTLRRTTVLLWPVVALMLGLALALWLVARRPLTLLTRLRGRLATVAGAIGTAAAPGPAIAAFRQKAGNNPWARLDPFADCAAQKNELTTRICGLQTIKVFSLGPDDATYKDVDAKLAQLEAGVSALVPLADDLGALARAVATVEATRYVPAWVAHIRTTFLAEATVTVASISQRKADVEAATTFALGFQAVALQLGAMRERLDELRTKDRRLSDAEKQRVAEAREKFAAALGELQIADSIDEVGRVLSTEVKGARVAIAELADIGADQAVVAAAATPVSLLSSDMLVPAAGTATVEIGVTAERAQNVVAIVFVAALLVCAGLQALVIGKAFGTWWDFVQAVAWGAGSTTVAAPLVTAWETLATSRSTTHGQ